VVDVESWKIGFEAALDVCLEVLRARVDVQRSAVKEIEDIAAKVRSEKAEKILETLTR
jgi:hypothetical protein